MEFMTKKQIRNAVASMIVYPILFALCIVFVFLRGLSNLQDTYIINISMDLFGMMMGYVLYICCLFDVEKSESDLKNYFYLLNVTYLTLFLDACSWLVDGVPELRIANIVDNTLYFACSPIQAYFFWLYLSSFMKIEIKKYRSVNIMMNVGLAVALLSRAVNIFTGHYFTIGSDGVYHRSIFFPIALIYVFATLIAVAVIVIKERKRF